jgi:hypothetical protein
LKNNLTHPNEYVRGSTLRFLCKIKEVEILESLIPSVTANLVCVRGCLRLLSAHTQELTDVI